MAHIRERIGRDGEKVYQFIVRRKGFQPIAKTFQRKTDGYAWAQEAEVSMRLGKYHAQSRASDMTVSELIDNYVTTTFKDRRSKNTPLQTLSWWKTQIGGIAIKHVTRTLIRNYWDELSKIKSERTGQVLKPRTLNCYIETISACFSFAVHEDWLQFNPIKGLKRKRLNNARNVEPLTHAQLQALLDAASTSEHPYLKMAILLALSTSARRSEVMGLRWDEINFDTAEVRFVRTKNGRSRISKLGAVTLDALKEHERLHRKESELVFPPIRCKYRHETLDGHIYLEDLSDHFEKACKKAGIEGFTWHDLRHCAVSYFILAGASKEEAMLLSGHETESMLRRYTHFFAARAKELADRVEDSFLRA